MLSQRRLIFSFTCVTLCLVYFITRVFFFIVDCLYEMKKKKSETLISAICFEEAEEKMGVTKRKKSGKSKEQILTSAAERESERRKFEKKINLVDVDGDQQSVVRGAIEREREC